jgi:hypothetical protein
LELPTIQYVTRSRKVLEGDEFNLFCASKGQSNSINLYEHIGRHLYLVSQGKGFTRKVVKAAKSKTYTCEVESDRVHVEEDFSIDVLSEFYL